MAVGRARLKRLAGVREAVEFLLDDQKIFARRLRCLHEPFLKMGPLLQFQVVETPFFKSDEAILLHLKHPRSPKSSSLAPLPPPFLLASRSTAPCRIVPEVGGLITSLRRRSAPTRSIGN